MAAGLVAWLRRAYLRIAMPEPHGDLLDPYVETMQVEEEKPSMWGWTEVMGWVQDESVGLKQLGEKAEARYRLNVGREEDGMIECVTWFSF